MSTDYQLPNFPRPAPRTSLRIFFTSLWAFMLREIKNRYSGFHLGYVWAVLDPAISVGFLVMMRAVIRGSHEPILSESPVIFFVWGVVPYFMFSHTVGAAGGTFGGSRGLFNYRQIRPLDIVLAKGLIEWLQLGVTLLLFLAGWTWFGQPLYISNPLAVLIYMVLLFLFGLVLGFLFEVFSTVFPDLRRIFALLMRPMLLISGLFFTIDMIPQQWKPYLLWNPILHLIDLVRGAAMLNYESPGDVGYVCVCISVIGIVALSAYRRYMHYLI